MRIVIIGSGYVGLVSGACFADLGHKVICVDNDSNKIEALQRGVIPFYEPGLEDLVAHGTASGLLDFTTQLSRAVVSADAVFIAVGTPPQPDDGQADLSAVYQAARQIAQAISGFTLIVTKSTVPLGTGDEIERIVRNANPHADFAVVSNPEFLREGSAISDFRHPDRIVIGCHDRRACNVMADLYAPLGIKASAMLYTSRRAAEMIKYAANAFLAMKITFVNEVADLCEVSGADIADVTRGIGMDLRIGDRFLEVGPGYGGSCFPKDTLALVRTAQAAGRPLRLIETTVDVNEQRKRNMASKVIAACGGSVSGKTICILGLTFKPNTDDMRCAPSLDIIRSLQAAGARIRAYDPFGMDVARRVLYGVVFAEDPYLAALGAEAVVIVTHWGMFAELDLGRLRSVVASPVIVDLRNICSAEQAAEYGFSLSAVGRPAMPPPAAMIEAQAIPDFVPAGTPPIYKTPSVMRAPEHAGLALRGDAGLGLHTEP